MTQNIRLTGILITASVLLLIPLVAMQFTSEVVWTTSDFIIAGVLLFGTGLLCELTMRKVKSTKGRLALVTTILGLLFIIWAELAVGVFGTPFAGS